MATHPPPKPNIDYVTLADTRLEALVSADAETEWRVVGRPNMPDVHVFPVPSSDDEKEFRRWADEWIGETGFLSDPTRKSMHRAHFKIIGMGEKALPLILKEVQRMTAHWFVALDAISPVNPVRPEDQTNLVRTANAWLEWGRGEKLI